MIRGVPLKAAKNYKESLLKDLQDPREALGYLSAALEDPDKRVFLLALRDVAEAHGGMTRLARLTKISREHIYRMLSKQGNPELKTLMALIEALGFKFSLERKSPRNLKMAA